MASLDDLKKNIECETHTKNYKKAMKMVAAAKLRKSSRKC